MSMRRMVGKGEVVAGARSREEDGVNTPTTTMSIIVEIMWELPLQIIQSILSHQL